MREATDGRIGAFLAASGPPSSFSCWEWTGAMFTSGYGSFKLAGKSRRAHRYAYEALVGPVPDGLELDHLCHNKRCVNPSHLEPVTHAENMRRGIQAGSHKSHCAAGHPFDEANTYRRPDRPDHQDCRACRRAAVARSYARKKVA